MLKKLRTIMQAPRQVRRAKNEHQSSKKSATALRRLKRERRGIYTGHRGET